MNSDQPTMPSSVVTFRKELTRQPASQCRVSMLVIFIELRLSMPGCHSEPTGPACGRPEDRLCEAISWELRAASSRLLRRCAPRNDTELLPIRDLVQHRFEV